jgi:hypothetical protein
VLAVRGVAILLGIVVIVWILRSAVTTLVLPRGVADGLTRVVFSSMRRVFDLRASRARTYIERDRIMALYAPLSLLSLPFVWLTFVLIGYAGIYWGIEGGTSQEALRASGSSLLTLGFVSYPGVGPSALVFSEASIGLLLAALLIAYLPTMHAAWSRREAAVARLAVRAGSPPSAWELLIRFHRIGQLARLPELWGEWELWFVDIEESHTSLAALAFFRSPQPERSWITAAGTVLDGAALWISTVDGPSGPEAHLCLRAGFMALCQIAAYFRIEYDASPSKGDPISITREEFDEVYDRLAAAGVPVRADRHGAWDDFAGWRVNYDAVLLRLAAMTVAPYAPWSSDRSMDVLGEGRGV